jgi:phenylpyruvate tautomerase PptA (4-oxalocrotonate tautomerase family)
MLIDKIRGSRGRKIAEDVPKAYLKELQIPENMRKLISDVTRVLLDRGGIPRDQVETIIRHFDEGEYGGMFEGITEGFRESYRKGYRRAKTRYEKRIRQRDEQLRQDQERIRLLEEEIRRLHGK